jgi:hypothetical protein
LDQIIARKFFTQATPEISLVYIPDAQKVLIASYPIEIAAI